MVSVHWKLILTHFFGLPVSESTAKKGVTVLAREINTDCQGELDSTVRVRKSIWNIGDPIGNLLFLPCLRLKLMKKWGAWVAQSVEHPTSAQVMNSRIVGWSLASGSVLTAQILCLLLSLLLSRLHSVSLCLSVSLSKIKIKIKKIF